MKNMLKYLLEKSGDFTIKIVYQGINHELKIYIDYVAIFSQYFQNIQKKQFTEKSDVVFKDLASVQIFKYWLSALYENKIPDVSLNMLAKIIQLNDYFICESLVQPLHDRVNEKLSEIKPKSDIDDFYRRKLNMNMEYREFTVKYWKNRGIDGVTNILTKNLYVKCVKSKYFNILQFCNDIPKLIAITDWDFMEAAKYPQYKREIVESMWLTN
jgi:hypothetical protein